MAANLEIERKFLLKCLPKRREDDIYQIEQYYLKNSAGIWERARTYHSEINGDMYIHTIKTSVSKGVNMEDEYQMTKDEFDSFREKCYKHGADSKHISKERWIYKDGPLKWEVDKFNSGYNLIVAEIELPTEKYKLTVPQFIKDVMLLEVTGLKQFSNRALSLKIN
jgi:hypothetical protein